MHVTMNVHATVNKKDYRYKRTMNIDLKPLASAVQSVVNLFVGSRGEG